jgi:hypothetical protein
MPGFGYGLTIECLTLSVGRTDNIRTTSIPVSRGIMRDVMVLAFAVWRKKKIKHKFLQSV